MIRCYHCGWTYQENELQTINYEGQVLRICPACLKELKLSEYQKRWEITKSKKDVRWGWMGLFIVILVILLPFYNIGTIITDWNNALIYDYFNKIPGFDQILILNSLILIGITIFGIYAGLSLYFFKKKAIYTTKYYLNAYLGVSIFITFFLQLPLYLYYGTVRPIDIILKIIVLIIFFGFFYWFIHYSQTVKRIYFDNQKPKITEQKSQDEALNILRIRYAKGEITKKQYDQMKNELTDQPIKQTIVTNEQIIKEKLDGKESITEKILFMTRNLNTHQTFYFTQNRVIVAKTGSKAAEYAAGFALGIAGWAYQWRADGKKSVQLAQLDPESILAANKNNYYISYSEIAQIKVSKGLGNTVKIKTIDNNKIKYGIEKDEIYKEHVNFLHSVISDKIFLS